MIAPMMKTEKNSAVLVQDLSESRIPRVIISGVQQGPIPLRADLYIGNPDNWPRSFHSDVFIGLTRPSSATAGGVARDFYFILHNSSLNLYPDLPAVRCSAWLGVFISAPAKSTPTRIELYPREFVFCPYRDLRVKGLRIIERRYCHVNPFRTDFVLDKQRRATTRGERA